MPRKGEVKRKDVLPDPKYGDRMVTKFMCTMMHDGKRSLVEGILYGALEMVAERAKEDALAVFKRALDQAKPIVEVRPTRRTSLAMRWLVQNARARPEKSMAAKLAGELLDAANGRGGTIKKKEDTHRMAEANKAFAHYRW